MQKDFITVTPNGGSNNATLSVTANKNTGAARSTCLKIVGGGLNSIVTVNQLEGFINVIIVGELGNIIRVKI